VRFFSQLLAMVSLLVVVFMPGTTQATTALYVDDVEQAERSTAVVVATIGEADVGIHPKWNRIMTRTEVSVDEVLLGNAPGLLEIEQMGGTLYGETLYVPGDARFRTGERCVLFLRQVDGDWFLTAMEQSKYRLVQTRHGELLERNLSDGIVVRDASFQLRPYKEPPKKPIKTLRSFRALMKSVDSTGMSQ